jgi:hypothetical protein
MAYTTKKIIESLDHQENSFNSTKDFIIRNLINFNTKKRENALAIKNLLTSIGNIQEKYGEYKIKMINYLKDYGLNLPQKSKRLETLLYTLRKQIENIELYRRMGISEIFPTDSTDQSKNSEVRPINTRNDLQSIIDQSDMSWARDIGIVFVYGNINKHGNSSGHSLLRLGNIGYLHINTLVAHPTFIPHSEFKQYIDKNNSFVIDVQPLFLNKDKLGSDDLKRIIDVIMKYSNEFWLWQITHHNCLTFARKVAHECGVSNDQIGYGRGQPKTPIEFLMRVEKDNETGTIDKSDKVGFFKRQLFLKPWHNSEALAGAARQVLWKNLFRSEYARVNILPNRIERENNDKENITDTMTPKLG